MHRALGSLALACGLALQGCPPGQPLEHPSVVPTPQAPAPASAWTRLAALDAAQEAQRERAVAAQQALGKRLVEALTQAIQERGVPEAVAFCHEQAPALTGEAQAVGVALGRTSHKLRNPLNTPPAWAEPLVAERVAAPTFLAGPGGELGALLPIKTQATCLLCHGQPDAIAPEVRAVLAERYPEDAATGFAEGDLRGWFWVEVTAE